MSAKQMTWRKWKIGIAVAIVFSVLTAAAGLTQGMSWQAFVAVLATALLTNLSAYLMKHPIEELHIPEPKPRAQCRLPFLLLAGFLVLPGCASRIAPGADALVVRAEELAENGEKAMDAFVLWEYRNRAALSKDITAAADLVREFGPTYLAEVRSWTKTYKATRAPADANKLQAAINKFQGLLDDARQYYLKGG